MEPLREMDHISAPMRERVGSYARLVQELFGESCKALTVFGSVLADGFNADRDTVRSALVVERVDLPNLRRLADKGAKLGKLGITAPLIMTPQHIRTSLDTFPLELMEIQQRHVTLFGEDHFKDLTFENTHVRIQCERELKRTLIALRQGLLASAGRERLVPIMEKAAGDDLSRTLRGLLWLKSEPRAERSPDLSGARAEVPNSESSIESQGFKTPIEIVTEIETVTNRKLPGIRAALSTITSYGWADFDGLYRDVEALGEIANAW